MLERDNELAMLNAPISSMEIKRAIFAAKPNSASGDDGLLYKHLQNAYGCIGSSIDDMYNVSFLLQFRPPLLNERVVRILPKSGKREANIAAKRVWQAARLDHCEQNDGIWY